MPFRLEADLLGPVLGWLEDGGFEVRTEVPILGRRADLVGIRADGLAAIEMKMRDWPCALRQAIAYQVAADWAWVAMPLSTASPAYRHRWNFDVEKVGLLVVDERGRVRVPVPAGPSPRRFPPLGEKIRADVPRSNRMRAHRPPCLPEWRCADSVTLNSRSPRLRPFLGT